MVQNLVEESRQVSFNDFADDHEGVELLFKAISAFLRNKQDFFEAREQLLAEKFAIRRSVLGRGQLVFQELL